MNRIRPAACFVTLAIVAAAATSNVKVTFSQPPSVNTITVESPVKIEGLKADVLTRQQDVSLRAMPAGSGGSVSIVEDDSQATINGEVALLMESQFAGAGGPTSTTERVAAFPWWVINVENVQIGADGTRVFVRATEERHSGGVRHTLFVMLHEGGDASVLIGFGGGTQKERTLVLDQKTHQHHFFEIVFDVSGKVRTLVSVNGKAVPADAKPIHFDMLGDAERKQITEQVRRLEQLS
ncbi:MAG: hypothetical protein EA379_02660 [Phycisphaerales bacterium]|nr:MAG: hypothetical protein EA379_02660 [Phycisphaerales bacterium]